MQVKMIEVRDAATYLPCVAVNIKPESENELHLYRGEGYSLDTEYVLFGRLGGRGEIKYDPYAWNDRTMKTAHFYIIEHWAELQSGDVVDVEFILGETEKPKRNQWQQIQDMG